MKLSSYDKDKRRYQLKAIRKEIAKERKYVPMGQGDGNNQYLRINNLCDILKRIKAGEDMHQELMNRGIR